jgi:cysteinyl-tRNA synthetase
MRSTLISCLPASLRAGIGLAGRPLLVRNALSPGFPEPLSTSAPRAPLIWYSCGPTVYADAHLGHARAYVSLDVLRRVITSLCGVRVRYALGVTDIDDKILARASESNVHPRALAANFERRFFADMAALNVLPPSDVLRVTEHVPELVAFVAKAVDAGVAYVVGSGDVYFSVPSSGTRYGKLDPSRYDPQPSEDAGGVKRDSRDFALWKRAPADEMLAWDSPWGRGRPGWHVECSAMATAALGPRLDLHTGGIDLRFPHHTNELATAEAVLCCGQGERWVNTWLHAGHLCMSGLKMSKSVKNFVTIREFLAGGADPDAFRVFCLLHHYAAPVEYSKDRLDEASAILTRIRRFLSTADEHAAALYSSDVDDDKGAGSCGDSKLAPPVSQSHRTSCEHATTLRASVDDFRTEMEDALLDDFDTARAMAAVAPLMTTAYREVSSKQGSASSQLGFVNAAREIAHLLSMLGISKLTSSHFSVGAAPCEKSVDEILDLTVEFRQQVRSSARSKNFGNVLKACDNLREQLDSRFGVRVVDRADGKRSWTRE